MKQRKKKDSLLKYIFKSNLESLTEEIAKTELQINGQKNFIKGLRKRAAELRRDYRKAVQQVG